MSHRSHRLHKISDTPDFRIAIENFYQTAAVRMYELYGEACPEEIDMRFDIEWCVADAIEALPLVAAIFELSGKWRAQSIPYWIRGTAGASFLLFLAGITAGNPLPPHYICPHCKALLWADSLFPKGEYTDGFDLPARRCDCGHEMNADGHDIPWQSHWLSEPYHFGEVTLPATLCDELELTLQQHWLCTQLHFDLAISTINCTGKDDILFASKEFKIEKYVTCFSPKEKLSELNFICVLNTSSRIADFQTATSPYRKSDFIDPDFVSHFLDPEMLQILDAPGVELRTFSDLLSLYGLPHGCNAWNRVAKRQIQFHGVRLDQLISSREDVFNYYISFGCDEATAVQAMQDIQCGWGADYIMPAMLTSPRKYVIAQCRKIKYLFPKGHAVEYLLYQKRLGKN